MGKACEYFSIMEAMKLIDIPVEEKGWLRHYGNMREHMDYCQGSIYDMFKKTADKYPNLPALEFLTSDLLLKSLTKR